MATPVSIDIDLNYNTEMIYIGETYNDVNGKMYRISPRGDPDPAVFSYKENPAADPWLMTSFFSSG